MHPTSNPKQQGNYNPSFEKSSQLLHFEAPELSYPKMTFPGHFWKVQNLENQVQIFEIQVQIFEYQVQIFEDLKKTSRIVASNRMFQVRKSHLPGPEIEYPTSPSDFPDTKPSFPAWNFKRKQREPGSTSRKIQVSESIQINSGQSQHT